MPNTSDLLSLNYSLSSVTPNALTDNATVLLQGLMQSWGWSDLSGDVSAAEEKQQALEQRLKMAIQHYLEEPDTHHKDQLVAALKAAQESVQAEYDHALQQQVYYQAQVENETQQAASLGYVAQWQDWAFQGVKSFFGSTSMQLVKKYTDIAQARQAQYRQLTDCLISVSLNQSDMGEDSVIDNQLADHGQRRRLLSITTSMTSTPAQFPSVVQVSSLNGQNGFMMPGEYTSYDCSGASVSGAQDINNDGIADVIIGDPCNSNGNGRAYVVFGSPTVGRGGSIPLGGLNGINGFKIASESGSIYSQSGYSVAMAGDINDDGISDLLIGAPYYYSSGSSYISSRNYVLFGKSGIGNTGLISLSGLNGSNGFKINGEYESGVSVSAAGDVNADGIDDLNLFFYPWKIFFVVTGKLINE